MRNNTHAHSNFPGESNLLKNPLPAFINLMNRDVLQLLAQFELNLQVKPAQEKIEKIDQRLRIQPPRGDNLLYIT